MSKPKSTTLEVQSFVSSHYDSVFKQVYETSVENWVPAYINTWRRLKPLLVRCTMWAMIAQTPMPWPITLLIGYELLVMGLIYGLVFWMPMWRLITTSMVDYGLKEWTANNNRMWVAVVHGDAKKVMGGIAIKLKAPDETRATLALLFVSTEMRGVHLGQQLLEHALEYARKKGVSVVEVNDVNDGHIEALGMFEKNGFHIIKTRDVVHNFPLLHWLHQVQTHDLELTL